MERYIAILRGINVGGHNKIRMADLRKGLEDLGLQYISTYIQSGNIAFSFGKKDTYQLVGMVRDHIRKAYGYEVPVIVLGEEVLARVVEDNPFLARKGIDTKKLHTVFVSGKIDPLGLTAVRSFDFFPDEMQAGDQVIYLYCPNGLARTKYTNAFFDKHLNEVTSMRNWRTTRKLLDMVRNK